MLSQKDNLSEDELCLPSPEKYQAAGLIHASAVDEMGSHKRLHHAVTVDPGGSMRIQKFSLAGIPACLNHSEGLQVKKTLLSGPSNQQEPVPHSQMECREDISSPESVAPLTGQGIDQAARKGPNQLKPVSLSSRSASLDLR